MNIFLSATALLGGLNTCLRDKKIRRLAVLPWLIGAFCYVSSITAAFFAHQPLLNLLVNPPMTWWENIIYAGAWILVSTTLLIVTLIASITLTLILAGPFHTRICELILLSESQLLSAQDLDAPIVSEITRTIFTELTKLIWLTPIFILIVILGFVPILAPVALLLGAWLLAFQFIDIPLDVLKRPSRKRIAFCFKNLITCTVFGLTLTLFWAIPFLGIFLSPAAAIGASRIVLRVEQDNPL